MSAATRRDGRRCTSCHGAGKLPCVIGGRNPRTEHAWDWAKCTTCNGRGWTPRRSAAADTRRRDG